MDNENYNCTLFVHQDGADYDRWNLGIPILQRLPPDEVQFEVKT